MTDFQFNLKKPYYITPFKKMPFRDFNRQIVEIGKEKKFPDGAVAIYADDDFYCVAVLPLDFHIYDLRYLIKEMWPEIDHFRVGHDHGSKESIYENKIIAELHNYKNALHMGDKSILGTITSIKNEIIDKWDTMIYGITEVDTKEEFTFIDRYRHLSEYEIEVGTNIHFAGRFFNERKECRLQFLINPDYTYHYRDGFQVKLIKKKKDTEVVSYEE